MIACLPCTPNPPDSTGWTVGSWILIMGPIIIILLFVGGIIWLRHKDKQILNGPHPEDAYVTIGNIRLRKSTLRMAAGGYMLAHSLPTHVDQAFTHEDIASEVYGLHNQGGQ